MPKYMIVANYQSEGIKGLLRQGGTARLDAVRSMVTRLGGKVESFYFGFGEDDVYLVVELPDNATAASVALTVAATGAVRTRTVVLLTPAELDEASKKEVDYRPPSADVVM